VYIFSSHLQYDQFRSQLPPELSKQQEDFVRQVGVNERMVFMCWRLCQAGVLSELCSCVVDYTVKQVGVYLERIVFVCGRL
jgi:hypothetical protein